MSRKAPSWVVIKFGGTSVSSLKCWQTIASVIKEREKSGSQLFVVCSAIAGISNELEQLLSESLAGRHEAVIENIRQRHVKLADELSVRLEEINPYIETLTQLAVGISLTHEVSPRLHAQVLAHGELMLTRLGAAFLNANGVKVKWRDAREYLLIQEEPGVSQKQKYLSAKCDCEYDASLREKLDAERATAILTQGFIAKNSDGDTVLLGRGGSDVSASYFAAKMGAGHVEIWTDVPGLYTANPRKVPTARLLKMVGYEEAQEIASAGAKVLHPRCIAPVHKHNIPLYICSMEHPHAQGTRVSSDALKTGAQIRAISARHGITLVSMETVDMWQRPGFLADVFGCFKRHSLSVDLVSTSETNVTVTLDRTANVMDQAVMQALIRDLSLICHVRVVDSCAIVSLVGKNIRAILHKLGPALEIFEEQKIYLVSQAANDLNLTVVVEEEQAQRLVERLHEQLFGRQKDSPFFGPTWQELNEKRVEGSSSARQAWWLGRKDELISLAEKQSPIYVYDEETIKTVISQLAELKSVDRLFYAVKANANPEVLQTLYNAGLGFECVSISEVEHVLKLFSKIDANRILFTPNFAPRSEYERAFKLQVTVTLDNLYPLEVWKDVFTNREIFLRLDPGQGFGHHKFVRTAGAKSKFGILESQLDDVEKLLKKCSARVKGLHAHVGSNIFTPDTWGKTALFLASIAKRFPDVENLDVGGGLGVVERPGQKPLDLKAVDDGLLEVKTAYPQYKLWMEPGRYIVAESGVLLTRVTQTKQKEEYQYVGVDAGMNTLIRPALYGSYHEIVNLVRIDEVATTEVNVVGPICESGDILGHERYIAQSKDGDVLLIATVGAYGRVMSSMYNMRPLAEEYFLKPIVKR